MSVTMPESPVTIIRNHWSRSAGIRTRQAASAKLTENLSFMVADALNQ
jgi:ABC-type Fe2+-enterobactin transport system substrate-binding protein